jgi:hypothetical protein
MTKWERLCEKHTMGVAVALIVGTVLLSLAFSFGFACLWGWVFMLVWNNLLPLLWAEAPTISFWLATGIMFVLRLILKPVTNISTKN